MVNTEIKLIIFFAAEDGEALYHQGKPFIATFKHGFSLLPGHCRGHGLRSSSLRRANVCAFTDYAPTFLSSVKGCAGYGGWITD